MDKHLRTLFLFVLAAALWRCSEPTVPETPPPKLEPPADSTSHAYTWEFFVIGKMGSWLRAVAADSDTSAWAVGGVELGYEIPSTPAGNMDRRVNALRIASGTIEPYSIDFRSRTLIGSRDALGVTLHEGFPTFWSGLSRSKMTKDSMDMMYFPQINGLILGQQYFKRGADGHVYEFGGSGFLARFVGPKLDRFEQIPTGTAKTLKAFAQAGPNEFYIGGWNHDSTGGIFHHLRDGMINPIRRETGRAFPITYATAIWTGKERLHAACPDFIYMQSLANPAAWDTLHIPPPTPERIIGLPICASGRADNDVFYAGHYGTVLHYNGRTLHFYDEIPQRFPDGIVLTDIAVTPNRVFLVGNGQGYSLIIRGTKAAK
jgi:hypothetical protein